MRTLIVIKLHVISNTRTEFTNVFRRVEIKLGDATMLPLARIKNNHYKTVTFTN